MTCQKIFLQRQTPFVYETFICARTSRSLGLEFLNPGNKILIELNRTRNFFVSSIIQIIELIEHNASVN